MLASTPVRKSFIKSKEDPLTFTPIEGATDDERRKRRSVYNVEHKLSKIPECPSSVSENFDQIKTHLTMCQKLFNENKINIHNAWNVQVIDYVGQFISKNQIDSEVMQIGARTLEVCVKVYGCKVDYIGQEVVRLSNNMASTKSKNKDRAPQDEDPEDQIANENNTKPKKRKRTLRATVVKDRTDLRLAEVPKVTSLDFTGNVSVDVSSFENMAINKIPMDHSLYKFNILNNTDRGFLSYDMVDPINSEELKSITFPKVKPFIICPAFKNFHVDEEDRDYNDSIVSAMNNSQNIQSMIGNEIAYDENGIPIPELDGSMHDIFADNANDLESITDEVTEANAQSNKKKLEMITSFCPTLQSIERSISSTSNSFLETVWVGPSHWKNKLLRPSVPRFSGKSDNKVNQMKERKTAAKKEQRTASINFDGIAVIDLQQKCKTKHTSHNIAKSTLPPNGLNILPDFDKLMIKNFIPISEYTQSHVESEFEHSPYDYNNADDSQYCSQVDLHDPGNEAQENPEGNDDLPDNNSGPSNQDGILNGDDAGGNILNENGDTSIDLIDAPDIVTQTYCPYALRAKNVNMKKLKAAMLTCLAKDNDDNINHSSIENHLEFQPTVFSEVFKELPLKLPSKQRSGLSVPLAFFSLLHLTNEYNLKLTEFENLKDIKIEML